MIRTPCILFAGGKSSRMGSDKALLPFGGYDTLLEYQYTRLQKIFFDVYISTKDPTKIPFEACTIVDEENVYAPTAGFVSVCKKLRSKRFFVLGVDMPFVSKEVFFALERADDETVKATLAQTRNGLESMCGIYHDDLCENFERMLQEGNHALRKMLRDEAIRTVFFPDEPTFLNLNKPQEYQKAKELYDIIV